MKIQEIISHLEQQGTWVNWNETRDRILFGDAGKEITGIGVCWVATNNVIEQAKQKHINFIISHENPFYHSSTSLKTKVYESILRKQELLKNAGITVYRCHDVWDKFPEYGVADQWAKRLVFNFDRDPSSFLQYASIPKMSVEKLAYHVAESLSIDGENGVHVLGDLKKKINRIAIGTGAATDIFQMLEKEIDALIVSDDGITNYYEGQYALDNEIPMIVVNHAGCEICGLKAMETYLQKIFPDQSISYLEDDFKIHYIVANN